MHIGLDPVYGFLEFAFLGRHRQLALVPDHVYALGGVLLEDAETLVDAQSRSLLLLLQPKEGGLLPLPGFLQEDLGVEKFLVRLVLAVDHEFESVDNRWGNILPSVRLKLQNGVKPVDLHLLLKHGLFVKHHSAQRHMILSVDATPSYFDG